MYSNCDERSIVHQFVEVNANVTVTPILDHGSPSVSCIKSEVLPGHSHKEKCGNYDNCSESCTFHISQVLCMEIPISFGVEVDVDKGHIKCEKPDFGPCKCRCKKDDTEEVYRPSCYNNSMVEELESFNRSNYYIVED